VTISKSRFTKEISKKIVQAVREYCYNCQKKKDYLDKTLFPCISVFFFSTSTFFFYAKDLVIFTSRFVVVKKEGLLFSSL